jgi:hypothetical protein
VANSPLLNITQIATNQASKEVTMNDAISALERSLNDVKSVDMSAGNVTLNFDDYTRFMLLKTTGLTANRDLLVPNSKRFFMVYNPSAFVTTVKPTTGGGTTQTVPAGSYVVLFNDGSSIIKISDSAAAGSVTAFTALPDAPNSYSGQGGKVVVVKNTEDGLEFGVQTISFLGLTDAPHSYASQALKIVRVNAGATGLEFTTAPAAGVDEFTGLTDVPNTYTGQAGKAVFVSDDETELVFTELPDPIVLTSVVMTGTNLDFESGSTTGWLQDAGTGWAVGTSGIGVSAPALGTKFAYHSTDNANIRLSQVFDLTDFATGTEIDSGSQMQLTFATATDSTDLANVDFEFQDSGGTPLSTYSSPLQPATTTFVDRIARASIPAGARNVKVTLRATLTVPNTQTRMAFDNIRPVLRKPVNQIANFTDLQDVPANYTGSALKAVRVNAGGTDLEFYSATFLLLSDTPSTFSGQGLYTVRVNAGATALEFWNFTPVTAFTGLSDVPASYTGHALQNVRVNAGGTALEFAAASAGQLIRTISPQTASYAIVLADADSHITMSNAGATTITVPSNATAAIAIGTVIPVTNIGTGATTITAGSGATLRAPFGAALSVRYSTVNLRKIGTNEWSMENYSVVQSTSLTDMPATLTAFKFPRVNSGGTAYALEDIPVDIGLGIETAPTASEVLGRLVFPRAVRFPSGAASSVAKAGVAATGSYTITLSKNGSSFATVVWSAAGTVGAWTQASTTDFASGDVLTFTGAVTPDATLAQIALTLAGIRI